MKCYHPAETCLEVGVRVDRRLKASGALYFHRYRPGKVAEFRGGPVPVWYFFSAVTT